MKEQLIEFETAKLAKEKGFDQIFDVGITCRIKNKVNDNYERTKEITQSDLNNGWCVFNEVYPTQSLLQKWLREKHKIHITVIYRNHPVDEVESFTYLIEGIKVICGRFKTFEQALEKGLFEALKLIN